MKLLRIFCAGRNALAVTEFHSVAFSLDVHSRFTNVLQLAKSELVDLTSAVLYKPDVQPYYPLALLLWRKKIRQLFMFVP